MGSRPDYDMVDTRKELERYRPIADILGKVGVILADAYDSADKDALRQQNVHRVLTLLAAAFGTAAVLFAIAHLSGLFPAPWPTSVEVGAAAIASFAVLLGLIQARQERWLLQRHKAERYRMLKFRALIDPVLWSGGGAGHRRWEEHLAEETARIARLTTSSLQDWIKEQDVSYIPDTDGKCRFDRSPVRDLVAYYRDKRIDVQMAFYSDRMKRYMGRDRSTRNLPPMLFFGSVVAVLGHFLVDILDSGHAWRTASVLLVVLAASLPVVGAGIRTYRSAHEFARSASLFRAKYAALRHLADRLQAESGDEQILRTLRHCEQFLESEHREWLRLMLDAEWFG